MCSHWNRLSGLGLSAALLATSALGLGLAEVAAGAGVSPHVALAPPLVQAQSSYTIIDLGIPFPVDDDNAHGALAINDSGQIVVTLNSVSPDTGESWNRLALWDDGQLTELQLLDPGNGSDGTANAINNAGQIAGWARNASNYDRAVLWQNGLISSQLPCSECSDAFDAFGASQAFGINEAGLIVGSSPVGNNFNPQAVSWQSGQMSELIALGGLQSEARAVNDVGEIVGWAFTQDNKEQHAVLWVDGQPQDLGTLPGGNHSVATDINNSLQIVGVGTNAEGYDHAILWSFDQTIDLGEVGYPFGRVNAINDIGQIVGMVQEPDGTIHAVLWENGQVIELPGLDGRGPSGASDINEAGQIVGSSRGHAVMWTAT